MYIMQYTALYLHHLVPLCDMCVDCIYFRSESWSVTVMSMLIRSTTKFILMNRRYDCLMLAWSLYAGYFTWLSGVMVRTLYL